MRTDRAAVVRAQYAERFGQPPRDAFALFAYDAAVALRAALRAAAANGTDLVADSPRAVAAAVARSNVSVCQQPALPPWPP